MVSNFKMHVRRNYKKMERLAFIKERYKKLILEPRKEIEFEIERDLIEEDSVNGSNVNCIR
ncbi:MAG: hypothetical protein SCARUB_00461 [Candidatus Scalindua rubra]|uniref:Uncharacterized protein n=1 Tax=Candidatus Scalindua rubra TaxID=1872076 RepID=A0A1E3XFF9_9BACT|nr:MAG: hypothetical protein SCARUB_00461 [Candidatus Scalindua rubra]